MNRALMMVLASLLALPVYAGPGHDHGDAAPAASGNSPQRRPDGHVFLPKPSQRQLAIRTQLAEQQKVPESFELMGRVVADPNAGGAVQAVQAGRLEPGPRGFPTLGQRVRKGEVLAYVVPAVATLERANQTAQIAEARAARALAQSQYERLKQLEGSVPQKEIEAAASNVRTLDARVAAIGNSLSVREALRAPADGVIAVANATAGRVVDTREVVFEIIDPARLRIEATAFDAARVAEIGGAATSVGQQVVLLRYLGAGGALREGALPVSFVAQARDGKNLPPLAVNQPVRVYAATKRLITGVALPAAAVVKNPSNQDIVWVHESAELFAPVPVRTVPLDGATVAVIQGLTPGMRIVVQGAPLINQVR
jgi:membrane fusion protein, heavy metal efflux system